MRTERTVTQLLNPDFKVYVWFDDKEIAQRFLEDAEAEGFTFADGTAPTTREPDCIMAINDDKTINYLGFSGHIAYHNLSENNGRIFERIDYKRYRNGEAYFFVDKEPAHYLSSRDSDTRENRGMSDGTAALIVFEENLRDNKDFFDWLKEEGFKTWICSKGWYDGVCWIYVNIDSKLYARGIPGIPITRAFGRHAVTVDEFKLIYGIFKKYEKLPPLRFE